MPSQWSLLGPHEFTKLLKPLFYTRLQQVFVLEFIHGLINFGRSFVEFEKNIKLILSLLDSLGFNFYPGKSICLG